MESVFPLIRSQKFLSPAICRPAIGLILYNSAPLSGYPPIYPVALSLIELTFGLDPVEGARFVNALLFGLIIYLSGIFIRRHLVSPSFVLIRLASVNTVPCPFRTSFIQRFRNRSSYFWTLIFLLLLECCLNKRSVKLLLLLGTLV